MSLDQMGFDCKSPSDAEIAATLAALARYGAPVAERSRPRHVVNGDSVAMTLAHSGLPGSVIVWRDVLCEGPLPPGDPAAVREARAAFLAAAGAGERDAILAGLDEADAALLAALDAGCETVLWFEHDLHDQLQLVQILARIGPHPGRDAVRLITLDSHPGHPHFAGLGELSAAELAALWPSRAPVAAEAFATAARTYAALQGSDTRALASLAGATHAGLPYLAAALRRLMEERPWAAAELGRSERQILRAVAAGATTPAEVFAATWAMEEAPYAGDTWIFHRVGELARREPPLVTAGDRLALTPAGRSALGRSD